MKGEGFSSTEYYFACKNCLYSNEIRGCTYSIKFRDFVVFENLRLKKLKQLYRKTVEFS